MNPLLEKFLAHSSQEYRSMRLGLERIQEVLVRLGNPQTSYATVLIAGTNGKGSVARMIESVLAKAGHPVGLYTSPHLVRFTERIRIAGEEVGDSFLEEILQEWSRMGLLAEMEKLTWFERGTVLAFEVFRRRKISLAILEVGLGGRLDATNVADPLVSAITSIGLDHTEVLGDSFFEIAREKAGVMRAGRPVVLGEMKKEVREFLIQAAYMIGARPIVAAEVLDFPLGLEGEHQKRNAAVAMDILKLLKETGFSFDLSQLRQGFEEVRFPGRLEWIDSSPPILLDGAHNPQGLESLVAYLQGKFPEKKLTIVFGMMKEKNPQAAIDILSPLKPKWIFTQVDSARSLPVSKWMELCFALRVEGEFFEKSSEALERARRITPPDGLVVVTGSLYLLGEIYSLTQGRPVGLS